MQNHSFFGGFSLNKRRARRAESKIVPPEISGNCTDAGMLAAAIKIRKFPVCIAAPSRVTTPRAVGLNTVFIEGNARLRLKQRDTPKRKRLKSAVKRQERTVKLTSSTAVGRVWCALAITPVKPFTMKIQRHNKKKRVFPLFFSFSVFFWLIPCATIQTHSTAQPTALPQESGSFSQIVPYKKGSSMPPSIIKVL